MLSASLYLIVCSARNRLLVRLRRLREPRYLIGGIVGSAYLYFAVFNRGGRGRVGPRGSGRGLAGLAAAWQATGSSLAGLAVFALAACVWLLPSSSALLQFSRAEAAFLFPAPLTRRQLLLYKILRSQIGSLIASVVVVALVAPASAAGRLQFAVAFWVLFVAARVYFAGVALTRVRLRSADAAVRRAAWAPIAIAGAAVFVVGGTIARQFLAQPAASLSDLWVRLARTAATGLPSIILWPFAAMLRPLAAPDAGAYLIALAGSLAVLAATTLWMLSAANAFELAAGQAVAEESGDTSARRSAPRARAAGWTLPLTGPAEGIFVWKNGMQMLRASDATVLRMALPISAAVIGLSFAVLAANRLRGAAGVVTSFSLAVSAFGVLFGPQLMRLDLRGDLQHLDVGHSRRDSVARGRCRRHRVGGRRVRGAVRGDRVPAPVGDLALGSCRIRDRRGACARDASVHRAQRRRHLFSRVGTGRDAATARRGCDGAAPHHDGRRGLFAAAFRAARRDRGRHRVARLEPAARSGRAGAGDRLLHTGRVDRSRARDRMARAGV
jgi:Putative ABC exporter